MSIEMYAFIHEADIPDRGSWQDSINSLGFPLELDDDLDPMQSTGFTPCKIAGIPSGFEIYLESAEDILESFPEQRIDFNEFEKVISFRWGGHLEELACSLASSAALVKEHNAKVLFPDEDLVYDLDTLVKTAREVIDSIAG
jgi:hypothetical protein